MMRAGKIARKNVTTQQQQQQQQQQQTNLGAEAGMWPVGYLGRSGGRRHKVIGTSLLQADRDDLSKY